MNNSSREPTPDDGDNSWSIWNRRRGPEKGGSLVPVGEKLSASNERLAIFLFDGSFDFVARQFHDNVVEFAIVFGCVVSRKRSVAFIYTLIGCLNLAFHLLTRKTMRTIMRISTTVPPPTYMVLPPFRENPIHTSSHCLTVRREGSWDVTSY